MNEVKDNLVPPQESGAETNTEHSVTTGNEQTATQLFELAKQRLQNVNEWEKLCGAGSASFQLTDASGKDADRPAQVNDHFKIDIPGPGTITGQGYDWARIEHIEEQTDATGAQYLLMRVRPATNPRNETSDVAHFFSDEATSNFMVKREGNTVSAAVYGRNESPNTGAEKNVDKARNTMVALSAMAGISKIQWKNLVKGLLAQ